MLLRRLGAESGHTLTPTDPYERASFVARGMCGAHDWAVRNDLSAVRANLRPGRRHP